MKQAKLMAKLRQQEIAKKYAQNKVIVANAEKSTHEALIDTNRLIKCDHYMKTGLQARLSFKQGIIEMKKAEIRKLRGREFKHVRKKEGKTISVTLKASLG